MARKERAASPAEATLFGEVAAISLPPDGRPPRPAGSKWTDAQWAGISTTGRSLLVSAAAGSGKTAVLAERCAFLVCDAADPHRADVDELLVVTFTEAAAAEMRSRIQQSLRDRLGIAMDLDDAAVPRLQHQLALVEHAHISTLHGFCARLLRQNFHQLRLDPAFAILDGDEAKLLRSETARQLFDERYENDANGTFQRLVDAYADGMDERLINRVIASHEMLRSVINPEAWHARAREQIVEAIEKPLAESTLGRRCLELIAEKIDAAHSRATDAIATLTQLGGFEKYVDQIRELLAVIEYWKQTLTSEGIDALAEMVGDLQIPDAPRVKSGTPGKDLAKSLLDGVKADLKAGALPEILRFTEAQWRDGLRGTLPFVEEFLSLIETFATRYKAAKQAQRAVDFTDLERLTLELLATEFNERGVVPSLVARSCHRRFKHVLVDEYQDINEVQDAILTLVSRECLAGESETNLFCVGDVKQSIYRFRLAEPGRFLARGRRFRTASPEVGEIIDLQANFRSRGPLLDVINDVFRRVMTEQATGIEYDASHFLQPGLQYPESNGDGGFSGAPIELHLLPSRLPAVSDHADAEAPGVNLEEERDRTGREALLVARRIRALMGLDGGEPMQVVEKRKDGSLKHRRIRFGDIVILLRAMRVKGDEYAEVLSASGIPVHSESGTGYFESTEVRDMLSLLALLDNLQQDIPMAAVLRSPLAALPDAEDSLARVRTRFPGVPFHRAVEDYARKVDDELAAHLTAFLRRLREWRDRAQRRPLAELIWAIYDETGYLAFCQGLPVGEQRVANLIDLHERARQFGSFHRQGLKRFIDFLEQLRTSSDLGQPSVANEADDVVRIMTVHGSKGLEFPVVIVPDLGKRINLGDCSGPILLDRDVGLGMAVVDEAKQVRYPSLASMLVEDQLLRQSLAEELRVLYVAMTRAREHLILIGSCGDSHCEKWLARWGNYRGALPSEAILAARCMLDWVGPAWAALQSTGGRIEMAWHDADEIASWPAPEREHREMSQWQRDRAAFLPLEGVEPNAQAEEIIRRVTQPYAHQRFTTLPAAASVTGIAKTGRSVPAGKSTARQEIVEFLPVVRAPRAVQTENKPTPSERGSATHAVLQRVDFSRACDLDDLRAQVEALVEADLISVRDAQLVELETIAWFVGTPLGKAMKRNVSRLRRELAVYLARAHDETRPPPPDPMDRLMVRSRLDVLMETEAGELEIVDYKTDRVTAETVDARAAYYGPQMELYREAIQTAARRPVAAVHLVFLAARVIHRVN